jgi:hypothetical protein
MNATVLILSSLFAQTSTASPSAASPELTAAAKSASENDLADVLVDEGEQPVSIYGFLDASYTKTFTERRTVISDLVQRDSFAVGRFNLYVSAKLSSRWRSLAEVRFLYAPNGAETIDANGKVNVISTSYFDLIDHSVDQKWGGIQIQRAWIEYELHSLLTIRGGQWLTPVGIWNVDHGSPTIIPVRAPYILRLQLFPMQQTGLSVHGEYDFEDKSIAYELTLSNGRGPYDSWRDFDSNKAVGGRAVFTMTTFGRLAIGASFYAGRYTDLSSQIIIDSSRMLPVIDSSPTQQYDEVSLGADLRWEWNQLLIQGEIMANRIRYTDAGRPEIGNGFGGYIPNHRHIGLYVLAGYRFEPLGLMPFAMFDWIDYGYPDYFDRVVTPSLGVNFRPIPAVTLKVQITRYLFHAVTIVGSSNESFNTLDTQVAWAF